jgi:hypothetical protein
LVKLKYNIFLNQKTLSFQAFSRSKGEALFTITITYEYLVFAAVLAACTITTWNMALRTGAEKCLIHLEAQGIINIHRDTDEVSSKGPDETEEE